MSSFGAVIDYNEFCVFSSKNLNDARHIDQSSISKLKSLTSTVLTLPDVMLNNVVPGYRLTICTERILQSFLWL